MNPTKMALDYVIVNSSTTILETEMAYTVRKHSSSDRSFQWFLNVLGFFVLLNACIQIFEFSNCLHFSQFFFFFFQEREIPEDDARLLLVSRAYDNQRLRFGTGPGRP